MLVCKINSPALLIALLFLSSVTVVEGRESYSKPNQVNKGMTWGQLPVPGFPTLIKASCDGEPLISGQYSCDPVNGDTTCTTELPILCISPRHNLLRPNYDVESGKEHINGWGRGYLALTRPVKGSTLTLDIANGHCSKLGAGFRMADYNDGKYVKGMNAEKFWGPEWPKEVDDGKYAIIGNGSLCDEKRFWVKSPYDNGNCW